MRRSCEQYCSDRGTCQEALDYYYSPSFETSHVPQYVPQRLVLRFDTYYDDYYSRSKAMKAVVGVDGVTSVIIDEKDETKMEVIGEEMDVNGLLNILRKKNFKADMEKLEEIKHGRKWHHEKEKKKEHHKKEEERKHKKEKKKREERKDKKHSHSHSHSHSDSDSGSSSSSSSESDSDKKKRGHHHNRSSSGSSLSSSSSSSSATDSDSDKEEGGHHGNRTKYIYRPTYPPQGYPARKPFGYNYNYATRRY